MRRLLIAAGSGLLMATPVAAQASQTALISADARRIVDALEVKQQIEFLIPTVSSSFAQQMIVTVTDSDRFKGQLSTREGRDRLQSVFREEFERAFRSHVGEIVEAMAQDYDRRLSPADLHDVALFVSSGAGARWASIVADVQQSSSSAGARLGSLAGEEAYVAVAKRLDATTGQVK